ncbi:hypothetical protein BRDID11004_16220 [Bradyrhizobium diazoefficiens]|uniref:Uncharacterized protein n=1 Tax=Bradyrhizobium diazoefficiens TaxID=1355477 RepID=A0A810A3N1_9BRAD|nr:hypothetical protein [Bradyrhizobium diazoefficiens]BBZ97466.1 hypothetical protein F07S3_72990 [Bradyrhizobium diazoefficiens]BCA15150.1 hypothetical protein BDHF08_69970 [Bradyrhizobium diazoefficiens]BCE59562.1 hypothetical protein XF5B_70740 [Bradyrhizobium diazoefficiens]BCE68245.1 hypothetical protein XF6B_70440 [Bradyrhizobium diazoefficiens]
MALKVFSINGAADLLEKDRATLVRALRHVPPDEYQGGQPRWRMPTIIDALATRPQARREIGKFRDRYSIGRSRPLDGMRVIFEKKIALMSAERSRDKRRAMAVALAPLLQEYQTTYLDIGRSLRIVGDDVLSARAELIWSEMMDEVSEAAEWPRHGDDFFIKMIEAMRPGADDDEAA